MTALLVVEAAAIVLLGLLVVGLLKSHAEILRQLHDLGAGRAEEVPGARSRSTWRWEGPPAHRPTTWSARLPVVRRRRWPCRERATTPCWPSCPAGA